MSTCPCRHSRVCRVSGEVYSKQPTLGLTVLGSSERPSGIEGSVQVTLQVSLSVLCPMLQWHPPTAGGNKNSPVKKQKKKRERASPHFSTSTPRLELVYQTRAEQIRKIATGWSWFSLINYSTLHVSLWSVNYSMTASFLAVVEMLHQIAFNSDWNHQGHSHLVCFPNEITHCINKDYVIRPTMSPKIQTFCKNTMSSAHHEILHCVLSAESNQLKVFELLNFSIFFICR